MMNVQQPTIVMHAPRV